MTGHEAGVCWFEVVVPRPSLARAAELLAASGTVELDTEGAARRGLDLHPVRRALSEHRRLEQRYAGHWPAGRLTRLQEDRHPAHLGAAAVARLQAWEQQAAPRIDRLETLAAERAELVLLRDFLVLLRPDPAVEPGRLARVRPPSAARLLVLPPGSATPPLAAPVVHLRREDAEHTFLLLLGPEQELRALAPASGEGRLLALPEWLVGPTEDALVAVGQRLEVLERAAATATADLRRAGEELGLAEALGDVRRLEWVARHLGGADVGDYLARISGWTSASHPVALTRPLLDAGIAAVAAFPPAPPGREPPTLSRNPPWARPFELFVRLMGTPGQGETDPSRLLAFIAPVLFGYMFGDLGQGALLVLAGFWLRRRWPALGMLIPGGIAAMLFGLAFGSVFTREGLVGPLWVHPVMAPLPVLVVPIFGGAALLLLGLLLNGLAARRGAHRAGWLRAEAGLALTYAGGVTAAVRPLAGAAAAGLGLLWYVAGSVSQWRELGAGGFLRRLGELLEQLFQLLINTLSFVRVGAFALAHAGLSMAVTGLADAVPHGAAEYALLALGNAAILVVEGLVVGVQTTRLILFEFFVRFFRASGRPFRPSLPPASQL